ncbi:kinase-like domain-containing protein [Trametes maxima]|nr:kinase-like domain-containing protein [Trametes maxima]
MPIYWDRNGQPQELPPFPNSFEHWELGQHVDNRRLALLQDVEAALSSRITQSDVRATGPNLVLEVELEDGRRDIVRTIDPEDEDSDDAQDPDFVAKYRREADLLKWLKNNSSLPVPEIRCVFDHHRRGISSVVVMEKMPGDLVVNVVGSSPYSAKERLLHAFADVQIELFRLGVPQRIGTLRCEDESIDVCPFLSLGSPNILEDYIASLLDKRRHSLDNISSEERDAGLRVIARLDAELPAIFARLATPLYRRCVLKHDDLSPANILMDTAGNITGVIDWEFQAVLPAALAVDYPQWIRYDGTSSPEYYTPVEGSTLEMWWFVSPQDAVRLRESYAEIAKSKDQEYWAALVDGEVLRRVVEWLAFDHSYVHMEQWINKVFGPVDK